jgi:site-specific recombinase XerC
LLGYLRHAGAVAVPGPLLLATRADVMLARYACYLAAERGLAQSIQPVSAAAPPVPRMAGALRSLLRFLHVDGVTGAGVADAVAARKLAGLPKALAADQVAAMLAACDRGTAVGRRHLAVLTVMSRLGLRAGAADALRLDDIHWRQGEFTVTGKRSRQDRLPLPADVGNVVVRICGTAGPAPVTGRCSCAPGRRIAG